MTKINFNDLIPQEIISVIEKIQKAGFEAYLVGGSVRDMAMNIQPKD
jgi:poly(A) polymerase